jgi:hypothetical protein
VIQVNESRYCARPKLQVSQRLGITQPKKEAGYIWQGKSTVKVRLSGIYQSVVVFKKIHLPCKLLEVGICHRRMAITIYDLTQKRLVMTGVQGLVLSTKILKSDKFSEKVRNF